MQIDHALTVKGSTIVAVTILVGFAANEEESEIGRFNISDFGGQKKERDSINIVDCCDM